MGTDKAVVQRARIGKMYQQPSEQHGVHAGCDLKEKVGVFGGGGAARIDHHNPRAARAFVGNHALIQHRMAPGGVGSDKNNKISEIEILVSARYRIGAESAAMPRHRGRHTQSRIRVDIGRSDETLHDLVRDVVVLRQQLSGKIEGDRIWTVPRDCAGESIGHPSKRAIP